MGLKKSQVFFNLKQQILLENRVFSARKDYASQAITLLSGSCFTQEEMYNQICSLIKLGLYNDTTISSAYENALIYYLAKNSDIEIPLKLKEYITEYALKSIITKRFPMSLRALVGYLLVNGKVQSEGLKHGIENLHNEALGLIKNGNIVAAIDGLFASHSLDEKNIATLYGFVKSEASNIGREKVAKFALELMRWDKPEQDDVLDQLEELIESDFQYWVVPDIQFALIESEKLVNTNLPLNVIIDLFDMLKKSGEPWANKIDGIKDKGIFVDLSSYSRMPSFSPVEDVLSIIALIEGKRIEKYELSKEEYKDFLQLRNIEQNGKMASLDGAIILACFYFFIGIVFCLNTVLRWTVMIDSFGTIRTISTDPGNIGEWFGLLTNPIVITIYLLYWARLIYLKYKVNRNIQFIDYIYTMPLFGGWIKNTIRGEK